MQNSKRRLWVVGVILGLFLIGLTACSSSLLPAAESAQAASQPVEQTDDPQSPQLLTLTPSQVTVGTEVEATATDLPPGATVDLLWRTVEGGWVVEDYFRFNGKQFSDITQPLGQAVVQTDGRLQTRITIPEDYGGVHDVLVVSAEGVTLAQGGLELTASFEMNPAEGPVGTVIEIQGKGLGWRTMESTWVANWDNQEVGWISAVDTRGTTVARFRATGPVGDHIVKVYSGYMGQSYLNYEQAPTAYLPRPEFVFRITPGGQAPQSYAEPYQPQPLPAASSAIGADLTVTPSQGPVSTGARLVGEGLPANQLVSLVWETQIGNRVSDTGFAAQETQLAQLTTDAEGRLETTVSIPDDLGGQHALVLHAEDTELARTYFAIETSIVSITPTSGPVGTPVTIHLKGVGWTEYDNIYIATYDNAYMGYACGFNSQGDVVINFTASGAPGVHLIDLYPGIYKGPAEGQQLYRLPQLTYADDHPGNKIPALRFAFEVTE
jgi:hypothetical protein